MVIRQSIVGDISALTVGEKDIRLIWSMLCAHTSRYVYLSLSCALRNASEELILVKYLPYNPLCIPTSSCI